MVKVDLLRNIGSHVRESLKPLIEQYPSEFTERYAGLCGIASYTTNKILKKLKIKNNIIIYDQCGIHCFNNIDDVVLDCTATQFKEYRNKDILIIDKGYYLFWEPGFITSYNDFDFSDWPEIQQPSTHSKLIKKIVSSYKEKCQ